MARKRKPNEWIPRQQLVQGAGPSRVEEDIGTVAERKAPDDARYIVTETNPDLTFAKLLGVDIIMRGTLAARPAAGIPGRLYYVTDASNERLTRDDGATWHDIEADWDFITGKPATFPPGLHAASHQHGGSDEVATAAPGANAVPKAGASGKLASGWVVITRSVVLPIPGDPAAATPVTMRVAVPVAGVITAIKHVCRVTAATTYTYDVNKNGATLYTTQGNRPTRTAANGTTLVTAILPDVTALAIGDILEIDLDIQGTGVQDVVFFIEYE